MQNGSPSAFARSGLGHILRTQRNALGLQVGEVAEQLRLAVDIVEAMECDDRERLGATVFARGRLCSYARLLGVPAGQVDAHVAPVAVPQPPMVRGVPVSRMGVVLQWFAGRGRLAAIVAAVAIPMIAMGAMHRSRPAQASLAVLDPVATSASAVAATPFAASPDRAPYNPAPYRPDSYEPASGHLQLRFSGDSWVDIVGPDGRVLDRGIVEAGTVREYRSASIGRLAIGNPASVLVLRDGEPIDLEPFREAKQARFALSSRGQPTPTRD